jgi:excinuclease ABC subunit A
VGVLYVLDEPSIGLHPRDNQRLVATLQGLRDLGNSVVVVEHDEEMIRAADYVLDVGPGAGRRGGQLVASGSVAQITRNSKSLTGAFLRGERRIPLPDARRSSERSLRVVQAERHNLQKIDVDFPLQTLTVVTGVSGSGKSTLVMEILKESVEAHLQGHKGSLRGCQRIQNLHEVRQLVVIDQSPLGTTPSSNPATYSKVFDPIREVFAGTEEARIKGFTRSRFSFNQGAGRCQACSGRGAVLVEMHFLSDLWVPCESCRGRRYNQETLAATYRGKNINDVLQMEVHEAAEFFANHKKISRILGVLDEVGLGYLKLGQSSTTLSGGEAQRVKLAAELARPSTGRTLYLLDEPTTGLHFADVEKLVSVFHRLVERSNTVVVIEHHLDVIKNADHLIDLGPEGGERGGQIVATGTPEELGAHKASHTGAFLRPLLQPTARRAPRRGKSIRVPAGGGS